jgi:YgiT-type zinc finger domain-containing protein
MNCEQCRIGQFHPTTAPYMRWHSGSIMVIPDVPAHACDICGEMVYDINFINKLQFLLERLTDEAPLNEATMRQMRAARAEDDSSWLPSRRGR